MESQPEPFRLSRKANQSHSNSQGKPTRAIQILKESQPKPFNPSWKPTRATIQTLNESQPEPFSFSLKANQSNSKGSQAKSFKLLLKA
jgi:uncharacterized protein YecE (DUF72 family)